MASGAPVGTEEATRNRVGWSPAISPAGRPQPRAVSIAMKGDGANSSRRPPSRSRRVVSRPGPVTLSATVVPSRVWPAPPNRPTAATAQQTATLRPAPSMTRLRWARRKRSTNPSPWTVATTNTAVRASRWPVSRENSRSSAGLPDSHPAVGSRSTPSRPYTWGQAWILAEENGEQADERWNGKQQEPGQAAGRNDDRREQGIGFHAAYSARSLLRRG